MTTLDTKVTRDGLGIDTIARGIAYAMHNLKLVDYTFFKLVISEKYVDPDYIGTLQLEATINYDKLTHYLSGSNLLRGILPYTSDGFEDTFTPLTATIGDSTTVAMPDDIEDVTSLEEYLVWLILLYKEYSISSTPENVKVAISQGETETTFYKRFSVTLTYYPIIYLVSGNLIEAVDGNSTLFVP